MTSPMSRVYLPEANGEARLQQPEFHQSVLADELQAFREIHLCHEGPRGRSERNIGLFHGGKMKKSDINGWHCLTAPGLGT